MKMDGQEVTRNDFNNMLDVCLLHTSYHFLSVIPHGFHSGGASTVRLEGKNILNIHSDGHWGEKTSAKAYLARVVVQTTGNLFWSSTHNSPLHPLDNLL